MEPIKIEETVILTMTNELAEMTEIVEYFESNGIKGIALENHEVKEVIQFRLSKNDYNAFKDQYKDVVHDAVKN